MMAQEKDNDLSSTSTCENNSRRASKLHPPPVSATNNRDRNDNSQTCQMKLIKRKTGRVTQSPARLVHHSLISTTRVFRPIRATSGRERKKPMTPIDKLITPRNIKMAPRNNKMAPAAAQFVAALIMCVISACWFSGAHGWQFVEGYGVDSPTTTTTTTTKQQTDFSNVKLMDDPSGKS